MWHTAAWKIGKLFGCVVTNKMLLYDMNNRQRIEQALQLMEEVRQDTGQNPIHNYQYREIMHREILQQVMPSITRSIGGHGADAQSDTLNNIELKSSTWDRKADPTVATWRPIMFDMSKIRDATKIYSYQALGHGLWRRTSAYPVANFFVGPDHIHKLHPLWAQLVAEYDESRGRQDVTFTLQQVLNLIDPEDIVWFKQGQITTNFT